MLGGAKLFLIVEGVWCLGSMLCESIVDSCSIDKYPMEKVGGYITCWCGEECGRGKVMS